MGTATGPGAGGTGYPLGIGRGSEELCISVEFVDLRASWILC